MTEDIVARLRLSPVLMYSDQLGQSRIDYEACKKYINNEGVKMMREAADEIERLREALRIEQEALAACCIDRKKKQRERDEARREACAFASGRYRKNVVTLDRAAAIAEANRRGWCCFKEASDDR